MILLDTSGLLAAIDANQRHHPSCAEALSAARGPLLLSPFVLAELDYLLGTRVGHSAQRALLEEIVRGAYQLETFGAADVSAALEVMQRHASLQVGLADASIVVLARRHDVRDVLTLDHRYFRILRPTGRTRFRLLPADA